jgi:hypothetical protein
MVQNLKHYELHCPDCDSVHFARSVKLDLGPNGMTEKVGDHVCLGCQKALPLAAVVRAAEIQRKRDDLRALESEVEVMSSGG